MPLSNPFRRTADRPSLRERAAALRASFRPAAPVAAPTPTASPAPGSAEAVAAFHEACRQHSIRTAPLHDCPELMRDKREMWSAQSLGQALEVGEIDVAEYARLHPLASERELRFAEITHELNIGGLFALAYANEYPVSPLPDGEDDDTDADADLLRLGHQFEVAREREMAACEACNTASSEAQQHMPERPAALFYRASDHALYLHKHYTSPEYLDGREITHDDVEWVSRKRHTRDVRRPVRPEDKLPADAQFVVGQEPWPEAQARADEIVAAWEAWHAEKNAVYAAHGLPRLQERADKAGDATAALAERLAAVPARTTDGFRLKLRALAFYRHGVLDAELEDGSDPDQILSHSIWRDVQGDLPEAATASDPDLVGMIDFASAGMEDLVALHDVADVVASVAGAKAWTAQCHAKAWASWNAPGDGHNAAGKLMHWLADALGNVQHEATQEAKRRAPTDADERDLRWRIIGRAIIENGDGAETAAFARDLLRHAASQPGGEPEDPVLALIAESHRAEDAAAELQANWRSIPLADRAGREDAMYDRQAKARDAALKTLPTTHEGLKAFAYYVGYQASLTYGSDWRAKIQQEMGGDLLVALCAAVETAADA